MDPITPVAGETSKKIKLAISALYVLAPLAILVYRFVTGGTPDTTILIIVMAFMLAAGYVIFGEKIMDKATEEAKNIKEGGDENKDKQDNKNG